MAVILRATVPDGVEPVPNADEVLEVAYFGPDEIPWDALAFSEHPRGTGRLVTGLGV